MKLLTRRSARFVAQTLGAIALAAGLAACGIGHKVSHPTTADGEQIYVDAGPVTYQVQITRALNPYGTEDRQYLAGLAPAQLVLAPDQLWFGVFVWAKNQTNSTVQTSDSFTISDSGGTTYYPLAPSPAVNPYTWTSQTLRPGATEPTPATTAYYGPTQGGLLLFKLNDSVYSNRPLTLNIYAAGRSKPSTVTLDL
ncbi:MAG: hypothetical protein ACLP0J_30445 [Solirubrobacteraceae bacterium]